VRDDIVRSAADLWQGFGGVAASGLRIVLILLAAWLAMSIARRSIRALRLRIATRFDDPEAVRRAETLGRVFRYLASVVIAIIAAMLVLAEIGISVAAILGAAGVVGLAVGFGAQSLVKDFFTGFFLLLENQIRQGDVVKLGDHSGLVEEVTLRYVRLRDYDGNVHFVPNGTISSVVNMSRGYAQAVVAVGVGYEQDLDRAMEVMRQVGVGLRADPAHAHRILDDLEVAGVERWADSSVILRARFRVAALEQWTVRREYLLRLKRAFDDHGIEIPFPQLTVRAAASEGGPGKREALAGRPGRERRQRARRPGGCHCAAVRRYSRARPCPGTRRRSRPACQVPTLISRSRGRSLEESGDSPRSWQGAFPPRVRASGTSFARSACSVRNPQPTPGATVLKVILWIVGAIFIIGLLEAQEKLALSVGKLGSRSTLAG